MGRAESPKEQFNVRLPPVVVGDVDRRYFKKGWERPLQIVAAVLSFEALDDEGQAGMIRLATQVLSNEDAWAGALKEARKGGEAPLDDADLERTLRSLIRRYKAASTDRRTAKG